MVPELRLKSMRKIRPEFKNFRFLCGAVDREKAGEKDTTYIGEYIPDQHCIIKTPSQRGTSALMNFPAN